MDLLRFERGLLLPGDWRGVRRASVAQRYAADLAELRAYGAADSAVRSAHQTETAAFWLGLSLSPCTEPLRVALSRTDQGIAGQARLVALFRARGDQDVHRLEAALGRERGRPVFSGIHTRSADEAGITLGTNVARYVLQNESPLIFRAHRRVLQALAGLSKEYTATGFPNSMSSRRGAKPSRSATRTEAVFPGRIIEMK